MNNKNQISYWKIVLFSNGFLFCRVYEGNFPKYRDPLEVFVWLLALLVLFRRKRGQPFLRNCWPLTPGIKSRVVNLAFPGVPSDPNLHSSPDLCPPSYETSQILLLRTGCAFPPAHRGSSLPSAWSVVSFPLFLSSPSPHAQAWLKFCLLFRALKSHFSFSRCYSFGPQHLLLIIISLFMCLCPLFWATNEPFKG